MVGEGGGGGGGGSKYYSHYKMTHPNCRLQDVTSHVLFVHLSDLFISASYNSISMALRFTPLLVI